MRRIALLASKTVALSLAAAFALAAPASALDPAAPQPQGQEAVPTKLGTPAMLRDHRYQELTQMLAQETARHDARRAEIVAGLAASGQDLTPEAMNPKADELLASELRAQEQERWDAQVSGELGGANIDLPEILQGTQAVRGCSADGQIFRMAYKVTVNMADITAPPAADTPPAKRSLFYRLVHPDVNSLRGVAGTAEFMSTLKGFYDGIDGAMQSEAGLLLDETDSQDLVSPSFQDLAGQVTANIAKGVKERYNVTVVIHTDQPRLQGEIRCASKPAEENIAPPDAQTTAPAPMITPAAPVGPQPEGP